MLQNNGLAEAGENRKCKNIWNLVLWHISSKNIHFFKCKLIPSTLMGTDIKVTIMILEYFLGHGQPKLQAKLVWEGKLHHGQKAAITELKVLGATNSGHFSAYQLYPTMWFMWQSLQWKALLFSKFLRLPCLSIYDKYTSQFNTINLENEQIHFPPFHIISIQVQFMLWQNWVAINLKWLWKCLQTQSVRLKNLPSPFKFITTFCIYSKCLNALCFEKCGKIAKPLFKFANNCWTIFQINKQLPNYCSNLQTITKQNKTQRHDCSCWCTLLVKK